MILFLIEKGKYVTLQNGDLTVSFNSLAQYKKHSGVDLSGKDRVCYQPEDGIMRDSSQPDNKITEDFKATILIELGKIQTYIAQKNDRYFKKNKAEKIAIKKLSLKSSVYDYIHKKYDISTQVTLNQIYLKTVNPAVQSQIRSVWDWIESVLTEYYSRRNSTDADWSVVSEDFSEFDATDPCIEVKHLLGV